MSALDPTITTIGDLCSAQLRECGAVGIGQTASADEITDAWARTQWMIQQWERKRWLIYHLVDLHLVSTGAQTYTVGPGGDFNTGTAKLSARPNRLESAFLRQIQTTPPNQIDYPLEVIQSWEDYGRIALKSLVSFPGAVFLDTDWPLGVLHTYPVPNANIYEIHLQVRAQLPQSFPTLATEIVLPYEYYAAILYIGALRLRPKYRLPTFPGDPLPGLAKDAANVLRTGNAQIARLVMPGGLLQGSQYNIFSDRFY
jgi:hypothetical protein